MELYLLQDKKSRTGKKNSRNQTDSQIKVRFQENLLFKNADKRRRRPKSQNRYTDRNVNIRSKVSQGEKPDHENFKCNDPG
jgi:hypothetical protein